MKFRRFFLSDAVGRYVGRVPNNFPQMPIRIAEVSGIAAIERVLGRLDYLGSGTSGLIHHLIDFVAARKTAPCFFLTPQQECDRLN